MLPASKNRESSHFPRNKIRTSNKYLEIHSTLGASGGEEPDNRQWKETVMYWMARQVCKVDRFPALPYYQVRG